MVRMNTKVNSPLATQANELVNQVFYGTLLREIHEENKNPLFGSGPGGMTFVRQLDMELVKRMSGGKPSPIAQSLIHKLDHQGRGLRDAMHQARVPLAPAFSPPATMAGDL